MGIFIAVIPFLQMQIKIDVIKTVIIWRNVDKARTVLFP